MRDSILSETKESDAQTRAATVSLPMQHIWPGRLEAVYRQELFRLTAAGVVQRIWAKQPAVWKSEVAQARLIANRLGWLDVLEPMRKAAAKLVEFARDIRESDIRDVVLLGMGGSSLAPEVFSLTFPGPAGSGRFFVLDGTDPASIRRVERAIDLRRTLFIVASKSGKTIETLSQFFYFHQKLQAAGLNRCGQNFVAITDPGSYLAQLATEHSFRHTFLNPTDIGGRFSALSYFGLVPAALWEVDIDATLATATEMSAACRSAAPGTNPALALGALMGVAALNGADKLVLLATPKLVPLGNWIEQLVAESTGKEGKGIVPVVFDSAPAAEILAEGCLVAVLTLESEKTPALDEAVEPLKPRGVPVVEVRLSKEIELGGEFFKWELATAVAGAILGINPFDEPNVQESKDATGRILEQFRSSGRMPSGMPGMVEAGIEVYADGPLPPSTSTLCLAELLRRFLAQRKTGDYRAVLAFVDRKEENARQLEALRALLTDHLRLPVLLGYGPRYLHSIGQLYKGGPPTGMFLVLTATKSEDPIVPGANYTFGQLQMAQALGDIEALVRRGKPVLRLHLARGVETGLPALREVFQTLLAASRPTGR